MKRVPLAGTSHFEFRLEVFNLFNNVNYGAPNAQFGTANFGRISSLAGSNMRQMQLGFRMFF